MTAHAVRAKPAIVDVVRPVTADARRLHLRLIGPVTVRASRVRMRAEQGEFGLDRMVERPLGPRDRIVAILARNAESRLMVVIVAMAIYADDGGIRVALGRMALIALCLAVLSQERKRDRS